MALSRDSFRFGEVLGSGTFGTVYKATRRRDGHECVIKQIKTGRLSRIEREHATNEVALLSSLSHVHVINYEGNFVDGHGLNIVMEYAQRGDLHHKLKACIARGTRLSEDAVWRYSLQLMSALQHVHARKVLHRDIKTMNVMLDAQGNVKLGDFGVSKLLAATGELAQTRCGTPYTMSPELCESQPYSAKSDVWALGCVIYECCMLRPPFDASNLGALVLKIVRGSYRPLEGAPRYSDLLGILVAKCLTRDQEARPTVKDLLIDPELAERVARHVAPEALCVDPHTTAASEQKSQTQGVQLAVGAPAGARPWRMPTAAAAPPVAAWEPPAPQLPPQSRAAVAQRPLPARGKAAVKQRIVAGQRGQIKKGLVLAAAPAHCHSPRGVGEPPSTKVNPWAARERAWGSPSPRPQLESNGAEKGPPADNVAVEPSRQYKQKLLLAAREQQLHANKARERERQNRAAAHAAEVAAVAALPHDPAADHPQRQRRLKKPAACGKKSRFCPAGNAPAPRGKSDHARAGGGGGNDHRRHGRIAVHDGGAVAKALAVGTTDEGEVLRANGHLVAPPPPALLWRLQQKQKQQKQQEQEEAELEEEQQPEPEPAPRTTPPAPESAPPSLGPTLGLRHPGSCVGRLFREARGPPPEPVQRQAQVAVEPQQALSQPQLVLAEPKQQQRQGVDEQNTGGGAGKGELSESDFKVVEVKVQLAWGAQGPEKGAEGTAPSSPREWDEAYEAATLSSSSTLSVEDF